MSNRVADFVIELVSALPELTDIHRQHMAEQGELLPHVLMGEITRLVIARSASYERGDWLAELLRKLEAGLVSGDSDIAELVAVSFVENLCGEDGTIAALRPIMGEALRREVKVICGA